MDFHCHTRASFDSLSSPRDVVRAAAARGLTHLAITDHDRIDGALEARDAAPPELTVIVGEEVKTTDGDLICLFLDRAVAPGRSASETIAEVRELGGLVGIPHPFDRLRSSMLRLESLHSIGEQVDWVEAYNARVVGSTGNEKAAEFAVAHRLPGVAASDAHTVFEVGVAYTVLTGNLSTPAGLLDALPTADMVTGRASYVVRAMTPMAKVIQSLRGNRRVVAVSTGGVHDGPDPETER